MKRKLIYIFWCWLSSILLFMACDDMEDKPFTSGIIGDPTETGTAELYVLCEGLFNQKITAHWHVSLSVINKWFVITSKQSTTED